MSRRIYLVHLSLGATTYCGKPAGFHNATRETHDVTQVTCPRCLASLRAQQRWGMKLRPTDTP